MKMSHGYQGETAEDARQYSRAARRLRRRTGKRPLLRTPSLDVCQSGMCPLCLQVSGLVDGGRWRTWWGENDRQEHGSGFYSEREGAEEARVSVCQPLMTRTRQGTNNSIASLLPTGSFPRSSPISPRDVQVAWSRGQQQCRMLSSPTSTYTTPFALHPSSQATPSTPATIPVTLDHLSALVSRNFRSKTS
jgi:hypothetical protein